MKCMVKNCTTEFVDTIDGLVAMTWHVLIKHTPQDVN